MKLGLQGWNVFKLFFEKSSIKTEVSKSYNNFYDNPRIVILKKFSYRTDMKEGNNNKNSDNKNFWMFKELEN